MRVVHTVPQRFDKNPYPNKSRPGKEGFPPAVFLREEGGTHSLGFAKRGEKMNKGKRR